MTLKATIHYAEHDDTEVLIMLHGADGRSMDVWCQLPEDVATCDSRRDTPVHGHEPKTAQAFMALVCEFFEVDPTSTT